MDLINMSRFDLKAAILESRPSEFQARCRQKAIEKDGLGLLRNMKEKERKKFCTVP